MPLDNGHRGMQQQKMPHMCGSVCVCVCQRGCLCVSVCVCVCLYVYRTMAASSCCCCCCSFCLRFLRDFVCIFTRFLRTFQAPIPLYFLSSPLPLFRSSSLSASSPTFCCLLLLPNRSRLPSGLIIFHGCLQFVDILFAAFLRGASRSRSRSLCLRPRLVYAATGCSVRVWQPASDTQFYVSLEKVAAILVATGCESFADETTIA